MGRSYASQADTFSKMIGDDSDSDSPPVGIYEVEETSQEMYSSWSSSSRYPSVGSRVLPSADQRSFTRHNVSYIRHSTPGGDSELDSLSSLFQRTTTNLFGRDFEEAGADLARLLRPSRRSPRNVTPSLTFDDTRTSSGTSSSSFSPNMTVPRELAPIAPPSPPVQPNLKVTDQVITEVPEDARVTWTERTVNRESHASTHLAQAIPPVPVRPQEFEDVVMPPTVVPPTPPPTAGLELLKANDWDLSSSMIHQQPPSTDVGAAEHMLPTQMSVHEDNGRDELRGAEDDDYSPENDQPSAMPKRMNKKSTSSANGFKCSQCSVTFTRNYDMLRHIKSIHEAQNDDKLLARTCPCCFEVLSRKDAFKRHVVRVPEACIRNAKLQGRTFTPEDNPELFALCKAGKPPLAKIPSLAMR